MTPGIIIKLLRIAGGFPQGSLASQLGISRTYLSQLENERKRPGLNLLKEVSNFFQIPLALLLIEQEGIDSEIFKDLRKILSDVLIAKINSTNINSKEVNLSK